MHYEKGQVEKAEELLRISGTKEALADLGALLVQKGTIEEAEICFRKGKDAVFNLGVLYWRMFEPSRLSEAELCFLKSGTPVAYFNLGCIYESVGQLERAIEAFLKSGTERAWINIACLYLRNGLGKVAERIFKTLFFEKQSLAAGYYLLNMYLARSHKRDANGLNLPRMSAQDQREKLGVIASLPTQCRFAKVIMIYFIFIIFLDQKTLTKTNR